MEQPSRVRRDLAYIQGLLEGNQTLKDKPEGIVFTRLVHLLDEMAEEHEQMQIRLSELEEYVEAVDEDLNELEVLMYEDEEEWEDEDIGFWKVICPDCQESVLVDEEFFEKESDVDILCPHCDAVLTVNDEGDVREKGKRARTVGEESMDLKGH